jgi:DNA repair exonuclease SbcCD nuclease subunit
MRIMDRLSKKSQEGDILLTHIGTRGATLNTCFLLKDWSWVHFESSNFKKVYTGHFHSQQEINNRVYYPGSPIPFKFDEGDVSHGFYVYDLETETHEFVDIWETGTKYFPDETPPPQFCTITDEVLDKIPREMVHNALVRVALSRDCSSDEKKEIKQLLMGYGAKTVRWMNIAQKIDTQPVPIDCSKKNLFDQWIEQDKKGITGLDVKLLQRLHLEVSLEGDEAYFTENEIE